MRVLWLCEKRGEVLGHVCQNEKELQSVNLFAGFLPRIVLNIVYAMMYQCVIFVCIAVALVTVEGLVAAGATRFGNRLRPLFRSTLAMSGHFDYLVIGAGSGGMASARRAAGYGAKVGVIEKSALGGTCVNLGCVPKKIMFNCASVNEILHDAKNFGFKVGESTFDWNYIKQARDSYLLRLNGIYAKNLANSKVEIINGFGSFSGPNEVTVGKEKYTADHILIAVGGKPYMPSIPGIEYCISSDGFFGLENQPKSVAVIGGGYIGVELAGVFHHLGTKTDWFVRENRPLKSFDTLIVDTLLSEMKKQGMALQCYQTPTEIRKNADKTLTMITAGGQEWGPYDQILFATGRQPLTGTWNNRRLILTTMYF